MPKPPPAPLAPEANRTLRTIFLTLFIDLIGFSIIFPLFPSMLQHYAATESTFSLFGSLYRFLQHFSQLANAPDQHWGVIVLFGGVLGSVYSFLQFLCAPVFGAISDRIGRRPVLLVSLSGILVSYALWFFAGSFALLVLSRFIGGVMSANISTATAVIADITDDKSRSRGMAWIGIAFGLGFIFGPAIGGISARFDLTQDWPALMRYGVNPYSAPAAIAFFLTLANLAMVAFTFKETLPKGMPSGAIARTSNPFALLDTRKYPGVFETNLVYFLFLLAFSGMEFSLTFLAADRLGFQPHQNALMFLFIGFILALVQGGYVRRFSERIGVTHMSRHGLLLLVPGLALVGFGGSLRSVLLVFAGLFFLALGTAQATPCLTALASLYAPPGEQGRIMGIFRSLGALARALGPLAACLLYWRLGPSTSYYTGALFTLVPLALSFKLPRLSPANS